MYLGYMVTYDVEAGSNEEAEETATELLNQDISDDDSRHYEVVNTEVTHGFGNSYTVTFEVEVTSDSDGLGEEDVLRKFDGQTGFEQANHINEV